jgi:di/tricarboxylate transporter
VISGALNQTGLSEQFGNGIKRLAGTSFQQSIGVIMPSVALLSAFIGHVALTAIMLPVTLKISRENDIPPSKLLMPMSFAASLGTTIAIIGAPAFLIASGLLIQSGQAGLGIFSIAPIGLALILAGPIFVLLTGRFLLPARESGDDNFDHFRLEGYYTELVLLEKSSLIGKTIERSKKNKTPVSKSPPGSGTTARAASRLAGKRPKKEMSWWSVRTRRSWQPSSRNRVSPSSRCTSMKTTIQASRTME